MILHHHSPHRHPAVALAAGIGAAVLFWLVDSVLDSKAVGFGSLHESLLPLADGREMWMRLLVVALITGLGLYAYSTLARQREIEAVLREEIRQRERTAARLTRSELAVNELYRVTAASSLSFDENIRALLQLGCRHFGMSIGILSRITGERYEVVQAVAPDDAIAPGTVYRLGRTYCVMTLQSPAPVFFEHVSESAVRGHPAYEDFHLESYLGTRIEVDGAVFGTLNFSDRLPAREHFTAADADFLRLMAKWIGKELERLEAERALRRDAEVFNATAESIVITDARFNVLRVNPAFIAMTGYAPAEVLGRTLQFLAPPAGEEHACRIVWEVMAQTDHWHGEYTIRHRDGRCLPVLMSIKEITNHADGDAGYVVVFSDASQIKQYQDRLSHLAHHDGLTGLPNRLLFTARLNHALARARRRRGHVALLFVDLDDFKTINDSLGHAAGDALLQMTSRRLLASVRAEDTICRMGGDEFTVVLDSVNERGDAERVAEKIIAIMRQPFMFDGHEFRVSTSVGISLFPDDARDSHGLLRAADAAMYLAKQSGKNDYRFLPGNPAAPATHHALPRDSRPTKR